MTFDKIKKNFGFGCMRLKMKDGEVDLEEFNRMIDLFMSSGFNYFDTAHGYIEGKSERAVRACLTERYPRESYVLANKLTEWYIKEAADVIPFFESQLEICGVDYFDFYLVHCVTRGNYGKFKECKAFETLKQLKDEGRIGHVAMSFHDTADVLDMILSEQSAIEVVQLQINYLDYDDPGVQSKACYDVAVKHGKKVIVMEPVKGGALVNLPHEASEVLSALSDRSPASYALRYAASFPEVFMVLSGMGDLDMVRDNVATMGNFVPFSEEEYEATDKVREIIRRVSQIPCTACNYCAEVCPKEIRISQCFSAYNKVLAATATRGQAKSELPADGGQPADCIKCGKCEKVCPQSIKIRDQLETIAKKLK